MQQDGFALRWAAKPLQADREIVLAAVQQTGDALGWAAEPLQADREVVLAAVQQDGRALYYAASADLRADVQVVLAAVKSAGEYALPEASAELQADSYLRRLAAETRHPMLLRAFVKYARDWHEANIKARVDLWLTCHNDGELHQWIDATHIEFKRWKRVQLDLLSTRG